MQELFSKLNARIDCAILDEIFEGVRSERELPEWLREDYVRQLNEEFGVFRSHEAVVYTALSQIKESRELTLFTRLLYEVLGSGRRGGPYFRALTLPKAPEDAPQLVGYDLVGLFAILGHIRDNYRDLITRGVPEAVVKETLAGIDGSITTSTVKEGRPSFNKDYFMWSYNYINGRLLTLGRLNYQIWPGHSYPVRIFKNEKGETAVLIEGAHLDKSGYIHGSLGYTDEASAYDAAFVETDEYYEGYPADPQSGLVLPERCRLMKSEWAVAVKRSDAVLHIHIPSGGGFTAEALEESYRMAREIFGRCYPEFDVKVFFTGTWLISPELRPFLKPTANMRTFASYFKLFPIRARGLSVYSFLFNRIATSPAEVDPTTLPEDTSLQRSIKAHLIGGGYIHEWGGYFLF